MCERVHTKRNNKYSNYIRARELDVGSKVLMGNSVASSFENCSHSHPRIIGVLCVCLIESTTIIYEYLRFRFVAVIFHFKFTTDEIPERRRYFYLECVVLHGAFPRFSVLANTIETKDWSILCSVTHVCITFFIHSPHSSPARTWNFSSWIMPTCDVEIVCERGSECTYAFMWVTWAKMVCRPYKS